MRPLRTTRPSSWARTAPAALAALLAALTACSSGGDQQSQPQPGQPRTLTVLAAASLTEPYQELAGQFQAQHPGVQVKFDFEGSSTLVQQIKQGRKADVFASADTKNMDKVVQAGLNAGPPQTFTTNKLTIAVPAGRGGDIHTFADLAKPEHKVVVCAPQVPCGSATQKIEQATGTQLRPVSEENDVKSVLHKVTAGEADAGLVYVSDAKSAGDKVQSVDFPEAAKAVNSYPEVALKDAPQPQLAQDWESFVQGPAGQAALAQHGFGAK
jgi:molybdate transport system substrate-binding protein